MSESIFCESDFDINSRTSRYMSREDLIIFLEGIDKQSGSLHPSEEIWHQVENINRNRFLGVKNGMISGFLNF